jgi:hypothetical protein
MTARHGHHGVGGRADLLPGARAAVLPGGSAARRPEGPGLPHQVVDRRRPGRAGGRGRVHLPGRVSCSELACADVRSPLHSLRSKPSARTDHVAEQRVRLVGPPLRHTPLHRRAHELGRTDASCRGTRTHQIPEFPCRPLRTCRSLRRRTRESTTGSPSPKRETGSETARSRSRPSRSA